MGDLKKRPLHRKFLVPSDLVERSAFLRKRSGIIDVENSTLCDRIKTWYHDGRVERISHTVIQNCNASLFNHSNVRNFHNSICITSLDVLSSIVINSMEAYSYPVQISVGLFLKMSAVGAFH